MESFNYQGINLTYNLICGQDTCRSKAIASVAVMLESGFFKPEHICSIDIHFHSNFFLSIVNIGSKNEAAFRSGRYLFEYDKLFLLKGNK